MTALDFAAGPSYEVVLAGDARAEDTRRMIRSLARYFQPNKVVILHPPGPEAASIERIAGYTRFQNSIDGKATAYVCLDYSCREPTTDIDRMLALIDIPDRRTD